MSFSGLRQYRKQLPPTKNDVLVDMYNNIEKLNQEFSKPVFDIMRLLQAYQEVKNFQTKLSEMPDDESASNYMRNKAFLDDVLNRLEAKLNVLQHECRDFYKQAKSPSENKIMKKEEAKFSSIEKEPADIIRHVYSFLDIKSREIGARVCKKFRDADFKSMPLAEKYIALSPFGRSYCLVINLSSFPRNPSLQALSQARKQVQGSGFQFFESEQSKLYKIPNVLEEILKKKDPKEDKAIIKRR